MPFHTSRIEFTCCLYVLTVFCILSGELPISIIKMKTNGVEIMLSKNIGFTLPLDMGELTNIERLDLSNCSLTGKYSYMEEQACFPYAISYQSDRVTCCFYFLTVFCILSGELPISIIKMKTNGVEIILSENIGLFTLPLDMGELADIERLDLSNCLLTGKYSYM
jgi:hypothetical protein